MNVIFTSSCLLFRLLKILSFARLFSIALHYYVATRFLHIYMCLRIHKHICQVLFTLSLSYIGTPTYLLWMSNKTVIGNRFFYHCIVNPFTYRRPPVRLWFIKRSSSPVVKQANSKQWNGLMEYPRCRALVNPEINVKEIVMGSSYRKSYVSENRFFPGLTSLWFVRRPISLELTKLNARSVILLEDLPREENMSKILYVEVIHS